MKWSEIRADMEWARYLLLCFSETFLWGFGLIFGMFVAMMAGLWLLGFAPNIKDLL